MYSYILIANVYFAHSFFLNFVSDTRKINRLHGERIVKHFVIIFLYAICITVNVNKFYCITNCESESEHLF